MRVVRLSYTPMWPRKTYVFFRRHGGATKGYKGHGLLPSGEADYESLPSRCWACRERRRRKWAPFKPPSKPVCSSRARVTYRRR